MTVATRVPAIVGLILTVLLPGVVIRCLRDGSLTALGAF